MGGPRLPTGPLVDAGGRGSNTAPTIPTEARPICSVREQAAPRVFHRTVYRRRTLGKESSRDGGSQMAEQGRDHVSLADSDPLLKSDEPTRRLCIVSTRPLLGGTFVAALRTTLTPHGELEIIMDRRREGDPFERRRHAAEPPVERRHRPHVDRQLKADGFVIVPASPTAVGTRSRPISSGVPEVSVDDRWPDDVEEEERLENVRRFERARTGWLAALLILPGLVTATAILLAPLSSVKSLVSRIRAEVITAEDQPAPVSQYRQALPRVEPLPAAVTPAEVQRPEIPETPPAARVAVAMSSSSGEEATTTAPTPPVEKRAAVSAVAAPRAAPAPRSMATARSIADATSALPVATRPPAPRFSGLPRVEIIGDTGGAWSRGEAYRVRISDTAGRPLDAADVLLYARMADGTVQSIPLNSGSEPGVYRAIIPGGPAPVDLRVGITTSDKRVEVPLSP